MILRHSVFALALILLCSSAGASLLVSVSPKDPGLETMSLYPFESAEYEIQVFNSGPKTASNVKLRASAAPGLKIIDSGAEKESAAFSIDSIEAGQRETVLLKVKPVELSTKPLFLYVDYGVAEFTHSSATFLQVRESPLQVNAVLSETALDLGGEGHVSLSLKNIGKESVHGIDAELIVFSGLESLNGKVSLPFLNAGEGYEAKEFVFRADPEATGKRQLLMLVSFSDSGGRHVIEKSFLVEVESKQTVLYLIIVVIILLVGIAVISRKGQPKSVKKLEKPLVKEIAGKVEEAKE